MKVLTCCLNLARFSITVAILFVLHSCSKDPPVPSSKLTSSVGDPEALLEAARGEPLALFHPDAAPALRTIGTQLRANVESASAAYEPGTLEPKSREEGQRAKAEATLVGKIIGTLEFAFGCAGKARIERSAIEQTAVLLIESAKAYGVSRVLPEQADAIKWARSESIVTRLTIPLGALGEKLPADLHDALNSARLASASGECP